VLVDPHKVVDDDDQCVIVALWSQTCGAEREKRLKNAFPFRKSELRSDLRGIGTTMCLPQQSRNHAHLKRVK
jgi:hypothetical protein